MIVCLVFIFHLFSIVTTNICDRNNLNSTVENDTLIIHFVSNEILKFNRTIRCTPSYSDGCKHYCTGLDYGQNGEISISIDYANGTQDICSIDYMTPLQTASLGNLTIVNNKIRLDIIRPNGSFDYVEVRCPIEEAQIIFNNTKSSTSIDCSFSSNMPLMNFIISTIKNNFISAILNISREVPLPIPFTYFLNERLLTIIANPPPKMNISSTYEFQLLIYNSNDEQEVFERIKISDLKPAFGITLNYGLLPNRRHMISFKHIVPMIGYAQSDELIQPIIDNTYPFAVNNLHLKEEFHTITLYWEDMHESNDPIEYIVSCNSNENYLINVGRNTTYICEQMTLNETNVISVLTQVAIPGYIYQQTAIAKINVSQIIDVPVFEVVNTTEHDIVIRWNWNNQLILSNSINFRIKCDVNDISIDIQLNEYRCQSLLSGRLYIITLYLETTNKIIQRSRSIQANTLLQKCQYISHFYSSNSNGTTSVIIEWSPPEPEFDEVHIQCPSSTIIFQPFQLMPIMFIKCLISPDVLFTVKFMSIKSGYQSQILEVIDTYQTIESNTNVCSNYSQSELNETKRTLIQWRTATIILINIGGFFVLGTIFLTGLAIILHFRNHSRE